MAAKAATKSATKTTTKTATKPASKPATAKAAKTTLTPDPAPAAAAAPVASNAALGFFDVATVERAPWGILALIFNILPGGVGTIIAGAKVSNTGQIVKGILQVLFVWTVVVWVWSVVDGVRMFRRSTQ